MSTPEQPATPPLTRKQLRELRNTGTTPVIGADAAQNAPTTSEAPAATPVATPPAAPLPRPATPPVVPPAPVADTAVDLGASPLTRRQARQQERIRTASVPVITPEVIAAHAAAHGSSASSASAAAAAAPSAKTSVAEQEQPAEESSVDTGLQSLFGATDPSTEAAAAPAEQSAAASVVETDSEVDGRSDEEREEEAAHARAVVSPMLGVGLLSGDTDRDATSPASGVVDMPPSFDQLLTRTTGSLTVPSANALIVSQAPESAPLVAPITATGEVLITGTFNLPEGLGSTGHAPGTADGKEIDATLVDGELPSHSSPTPIAASAAVSTSKLPGEVIKPPAPEKGSRLMMTLAITAGALALALVGVLILAFVTGVF